jgi:DNA repair exonuclease SbcCD ATPase subunit
VADHLTAFLGEDKEDFDKLREESRQVEPPEPDPSRTSSPPADTQTSPSPEPEKKKDSEPDLKNWVPLPTYLEEKKERQRLEKIQQELNERQTRAEERLRILAEKFTAPPAPAPDKTQDPVGYLEHEIAQTKAPLQNLQQKLEQYEQQQQQQAQLEQIRNYVVTAEQDFAAKTPDYWDAMNHIRQARFAQYRLAGLNEQQQAQALAQDTYAWTRSLLQSGKNPAEATYELARAYGYSGSASGPAASTAAAQGSQEPAGGAVQPRNSDGTFAKPQNPKVEKAKETLKTVERGQQAAKSLGDSPGGSASTEIPDLSELASMSDEEFDRLTSGKNWKKYWN